MNKIDIVMQGPIWPQTYQTALKYLESTLVNQVIISTWQNDRIVSITPKIKIIRSDEPENPGRGNRNRQIVSSLAGLQACEASIAVKTRTDQILNSLPEMDKYFTEHSKIESKYTNLQGPKGAIFVMGMYRIFPFHPQDHVFWGYREDLIDLFTLPLEDKTPFGPDEFAHEHIRTNAYIGMHYYARFDKKIQEMIQSPKEYIVDGAPNMYETMQMHKQYKDVFKPFPKIDLWWFKHNRDYPYDWGVPYTEYDADTE